MAQRDMLAAATILLLLLAVAPGLRCETFGSSGERAGTNASTYQRKTDELPPMARDPSLSRPTPMLLAPSRSAGETRNVNYLGSLAIGIWAGAAAKLIGLAFAPRPSGRRARILVWPAVIATAAVACVLIGPLQVFSPFCVVVGGVLAGAFTSDSIISAVLAFLFVIPFFLIMGAAGFVGFVLYFLMGIAAAGPAFKALASSAVLAYWAIPAVTLGVCACICARLVALD